VKEMKRGGKVFLIIKTGERDQDDPPAKEKRK
jgi:hypothetical protein